MQAQHWNVGFLTYYKPSNLLFILIGLPSILFSLLSLPNPLHSAQPGLQLSFLLLLLITITMTNLQSSTRFLCSHPAFYINICAFFYGQERDEGWKRVVRGVFRVWQLGYFWVGVVLFAVEFPWT